MAEDKPPQKPELRATRPTAGGKGEQAPKAPKQKGKARVAPTIGDNFSLGEELKSGTTKAGANAARAKTQPKAAKKPVSATALFTRLIMWGFSLMALGLIGGAAVLSAALFYFGSDLPDYRALEKYEPKIVTRAYASDGRLLAEFAAEKRIFIPIDSVPPLVIDAFLSAEDKNFWTHPGVDFVGIARAAVTNLLHRSTGGRMVGASTITQQVAKNFLLTNEYSFERKIKEAILSFRIEQAMSKKKILELYLNEIYLGARSYGIAAASLEYFNKPLDELSVEEGAFLAALPKGPSNYNPARHYEAAIGRRNWVIDEMRDNGYVTREEATAAKAKPIVLVPRDGDQYVNYPYFAEEVRRKLLELYGEKGLYEGGLIVHTTMRPRYQALAEKALRDAIISYDARHGLHSDPIAHISTENWEAELAKVPHVAGQGEFELAVILSSTDKRAVIGLQGGTSGGVITYDKMKWASRKGVIPAKVSDLLKAGDVWLVEKTDDKDGKAPVYALRQIPAVQGGMIAMDPHTGRIFAIAGGFSYEMSQFNRASQAIRQPGSAFKPFVYLAGLENGFTPATLILDAPFVYDQGPGLAKWRPKNYEKDFGGPTTMRVALEKSRNLVTIRLANYVGMEKVAQIAEKFGVTDHLPRMLSMSIGAGETTLLRMAAAYSVFDNGGKKVIPTLIDRIQDKAGKTIYVHDRRKCDACGPLIPWNDQAVPDVQDDREQIADPRNMYQIVSMLEGVIQRGTGILVRDVGRPVAGKTGTSNDSKDTWFMGFTPDLVVGLYIGFDEPRTLGGHETGSRVAAPGFREFILEALKGVPPTPFSVPEGIRLVQINAATGTRAGPNTDPKNTIYEAFVAGTEPGDEPMMFTGSGVSTVKDVINAGESANTGLGGLY